MKTAEMTRAELKNFGTPDEVREFPKGRLELIKVGGATVGRCTFQPGWRWSTSVQPIAKTMAERVILPAKVMAPARTSFASACVGTPNPGTSMPMIRTPLISFGNSRSGTPEAVGTQRFVTTTAS